MNLTQDTVLDCLKDWPGSTREELAFRMCPEYADMDRYGRLAVQSKLSNRLCRLAEWGLVECDGGRPKKWTVVP